MKALLQILFILLALNVGAQTTDMRFPFATTAENWVFTSGGKATGTYDGTETALDINSLGRNNADDSYWEWTGTWEDLGVASGNTVTSVTGDVRWRCYTANVIDLYTNGPFQLYNSDGTVLIGEGSSGWSNNTTTSYVTNGFGDVAVTSSYQASSTTVKLRLNISIDNGNNASAETGIYWENIWIYVTDAGGTTTRRIFIIN